MPISTLPLLSGLPALLAAPPLLGWLGGPRRFDGQVGIITGAGSGIGRACALELARRGASVALVGRRRDRLDGVAAEIAALGGRALAVPADVTDHAGLQRAVNDAAGALGGLHFALANAGGGVNGALEKVSIDHWRRQLDLNVLGLVSTAQACLPHLRATGGRLGLVGSVMAYVHLPNSGPYAASKAAVRAIGGCLRLELRGSGVSCTTLHPGFVESEIGQVDNDGVYDPTRPDPRPQGLMWTGDRAARAMLDAMHDRRGDYVFTGHGKLAALFGRAAPALSEAVVGLASARAKVRK